VQCAHGSAAPALGYPATVVMPSPSALDTLSPLPPRREPPPCPDAAARRGTSIGRRNASACNGCGNGGTPPPFGYRRRISELGPAEQRTKQYRQQFRRAVAYLAYDAAILRPVDVAVADILIDLTHGGTRDYRTTEAQIATKLPPRANGQAVSKRVASDSLDRLRAAGLVDWDHGTVEDFYDEHRRALLDGRWQGPPTYRLLIPKPLHDHILATEAAARSETWRNKNRNRRAVSNAADEDRPSRRERERRQAQSTAAAFAMAASTVTFQEGLAALDETYRDDPELLAVARHQFGQSWKPRGPT
jgi:hypothetical protein